MEEKPLTDLGKVLENIKQKEKEIEELKKRLQTLDDAIITYEITENQLKKYTKYKQAIDTIKEICNSNLDVECPECTIFVTKGTCKECLSEQILQIIESEE